MKARPFYDAVMAHPGLEWEGSVPNPPEVRIRDLDAGIIRGLDAVGILKNDWERLLAVMTGQAPPTIMNKMSRIVGYFSRVKNWNRSKKAELRDRQAAGREGNYDIPEGPYRWEARPA